MRKMFCDVCGVEMSEGNDFATWILVKEGNVKRYHKSDSNPGGQPEVFSVDDLGICSGKCLDRYLREDKVN